MATNKARINFVTTKELDNWIRTESERKGQTMSSFITWKLYNMKEQEEAVIAMNSMSEFISKDQ